jgi:hypothetical protein
MARARREAACPNQDQACLVAVAGHIARCPASLVVIWPLILAVVADAVFSLSFLLGYAIIGLVVTLRRPANRSAAGAARTMVVR